MTRFQDFCGAFIHSGALDKPDKTPPAAVLRFNAAGAVTLINGAQHKLPQPYQDRYVNPLRQHMGHVMDLLMRQQVLGLTMEDSPGWRRLVSLDYGAMLVGSIVDWNDADLRHGLKAFQGATTDIWQRAIEPLRTANVTVRTKLPPLVNFSAGKRIGLHTDHIDRIRQFFPPAGKDGMIGGLVGMPANFAKQPLFWPTLAHEVIGHAIVHVLPPVPDHPDEAAIVRELAAALVTPVRMNGFWRACWERWLEEAVADVCALLGQGPAVMLNLAARVSVAAEASDEFVKVYPRGALEADIRMADGHVATEHPPIVLRLCVALGAMDTLAALWNPADPRIPDLRAWQSLLESLVSEATTGLTHSDAVDAGTGALLLRHDLAEVTGMARRIGADIAATKLQALEHHSLAALLAYSEADVCAREEIRAKAAKPGAHLSGTANQLLAGATMALYDHPGKLDTITANLMPALVALYPTPPFP